MFLLKKRDRKISCEHGLLITPTFDKRVFFSFLVCNGLWKNYDFFLTSKLSLREFPVSINAMTRNKMAIPGMIARKGLPKIT